MTDGLTFEGIGTKWEISSQDSAFDKTVQQDVQKIVADFEGLYSRFKDSSLVSEFSRSSGVFTVPEELVRILQWYQKIYALTDGLFTPLIGQTLVQSGYDKTYSFKQQEFTKVPPFDEVLKIKSKNEIILSTPLQLDLGGVGKGYLIDKISTYLKNERIYNFIINGGGDIYHSTLDDKATKIGLENPVSLNEVIGIYPLLNKTICSSAGNRRKWTKYHHIINPFTFSSPADILATWVVADSALIADTLSTCLFFVAPTVFHTECDFEYLIVDKNLGARYSDAFKNSLFV